MFFRSELPLDDIAKRIQDTSTSCVVRTLAVFTLQESPTAVEPWVVRAISEGVIDGRIDQLNRKAAPAATPSESYL